MSEVFCMEGDEYIIQKGDTLNKIASFHSVGVEAILAVNPGIQPEKLYVGQRICIPRFIAPDNCNGFLYTIKRGDSLWALAQANQISVEKILGANPGLNPQALQIGQIICVPKTITPPESTCDGTKYVVVRGDTFYLIAQKNKITVDALQNANPNISPENLVIGQILCVPAAAQAPAPVTPICTGVKYTVKEGDTLYAIAQWNKIDLKDIVAANPSVNPEQLYVGQVICLPRVDTPAPVPECDGTRYQIARGDTFFAIAKKHGVSVADLMTANPGVNPERLYVGQTICVPQNVGAASEPVCSDATKYAVQKGDTFFDIARVHGIPLDEMTAANPNINPERLYVGQIVCIPIISMADEQDASPKAPPPFKPDPIKQAKVGESQSPPDIVLSQGLSDAQEPEVAAEPLKAPETPDLAKAKELAKPQSPDMAEADDSEDAQEAVPESHLEPADEPDDGVVGNAAVDSAQDSAGEPVEYLKQAPLEAPMGDAGVAPIEDSEVAPIEDADEEHVEEPVEDSVEDSEEDSEKDADEYAPDDDVPQDYSDVPVQAPDEPDAEDDALVGNSSSAPEAADASQTEQITTAGVEETPQEVLNNVAEDTNNINSIDNMEAAAEPAPAPEASAPTPNMFTAVNAVIPGADTPAQEQSAEAVDAPPPNEVQSAPTGPTGPTGPSMAPTGPTGVTGPTGPTGPAQAVCDGTKYIVVSGDTFWGIGERFKVPFATLVRANPNVNPDKLTVGQVICVPITAPPPAPCNGVRYTVQTGDTLYKIAEWNHVDLADLLTANPGLNPQALLVGQVICIPKPACEGKYYTVVKGDTLFSISREAGVAINVIADANPGLDWANLAVGTKVCVPNADEKPPFCPNGAPYIIRQGDTLYSIAQRFKVNLADLLEANPTINPQALKVGAFICLPDPNYTPPAPKPPFCKDGTPYTIKKGDTFYSLSMQYGITLADLLAANAGVNPQALEVGDVVCLPKVTACEGSKYVIQKGDTYYLIAQKFDMTVDQLIKANPGVDYNKLAIGEVICLPKPSTTPTVPVPAPCKNSLYIVCCNDTVFTVAKKFGITVKDLIAANPFLAHDNCLLLGARLSIPCPEPEPPAPSTCSGTKYVVQKGDSFYLIAQRFGLDLAALLAANPSVAPDKLMIGQVICLPAKS